VSVVGPGEARPADGLAIDFVVEWDRAQLREIVQRVRDGRLRTNIGNVATLDDAVAALNPTERRKRKTIRQRGLRPTKVLMREGGIIACERTRYPTPPLHPATRAGLPELARRLDPLLLRSAR
jgi:hypothetical protein